MIGSHLLLPQLHQVLLPLLLALLAMCKLPLRLLAGGVHRLQLLQALQLSVALLVQLGGHLLGQAGAGGAGSHQHQLVVGVLLPLHWGPGGWGPALGALLLVLPPWDGSESPEMRSKAGANVQLAICVWRVPCWVQLVQRSMLGCRASCTHQAFPSGVLALATLPREPLAVSISFWQPLSNPASPPATRGRCREASRRTGALSV